MGYQRKGVQITTPRLRPASEQLGFYSTAYSSYEGIQRRERRRSVDSTNAFRGRASRLRGLSRLAGRPSRAPIPTGDSQSARRHQAATHLVSCPTSSFLTGSIPNSTHTSQQLLSHGAPRERGENNAMDHLLNGSSTTSFPDDSPDDAAHVGAIKHEATSPTETLFVSVPPQTLPHLATRLVHAGVSPNSSAASLGLHMLSSSAAAPSFLTAHRVSSPPLASTARTAPSRPRLPPISLLTAAAATLQQPPLHCYAVDPLASTAGSVEPPYPLRPFMTPPSYATPAPSSSPSGVAAVPQSSDGRPQADDMLCRYRNKKCGYPRAIKRNGERHNLCEHHRAKANQNQRKLESKRRVKKRMVADRVGKEKKGLVVSPEFKLTLYGDAFA